MGTLYPGLDCLLLSALNDKDSNMPIEENEVFFTGPNLEQKVQRPSFQILGHLASMTMFYPLTSLLYRQYSETLYESDNVLVYGSIGGENTSVVTPIAIVVLKSLQGDDSIKALNILRSKF